MVILEYSFSHYKCTKLMLIYKNLPLPFSTGEEEMPSSLLSPKYAFFHLSSYSRLRSVFSISPLSLGPALSGPICLGNTFLIFSVLAPNRPPGVRAGSEGCREARSGSEDQDPGARRGDEGLEFKESVMNYCD